MARTCLTTMSGKKSAKVNCKKSPIMKEDDDMQLKQCQKQIANHIHTSESHNNNNVMGEYDNNSISGNEIDLQMDQDLEDFEDDDMQFKFQGRKKPSCCNTSVTTSTNSETASVVFSGSACCVVNKLNLTSKVPKKVVATTKKNAPYDKDKPLDTLTPTETTIAIIKVTKDIFPMCHFMLPNDVDSIIWYILHKLGYDGVNRGQDHSHHWNATGKLVNRMITML